MNDLRNVSSLPHLDISQLISATNPTINNPHSASTFNVSNIPCAFSLPTDISMWPILPNSFTILNLNARSLTHNIVKIKMLLLNFIDKPDVINVTETWLLSNSSLKLLHLDGYSLVSFPRNKKNKRGGGIAFYIKNIYDFNVRSLSNLELSNTCESSVIDLSLNHQLSITIINIYKPPDYDTNLFITALADYIDYIKASKKFILIAGDFNINLFEYESSPSSNRFLDLLISTGFLPSITLPTRITQNSATLIDNIFTNQTNREHFAKIIIDDFSDHLPTLYSCSLLTNHKLSLPLLPSLKRVFSSNNYTLCNALAASQNWDPITP